MVTLCHKFPQKVVFEVVSFCFWLVGDKFVRSVRKIDGKHSFRSIPVNIVIRLYVIRLAFMSGN
jgi:hypothetical protein